MGEARMDVLFSSCSRRARFGLGTVYIRCFMNKISLLMPGGRATRFSPPERCVGRGRNATGKKEGAERKRMGRGHVVQRRESDRK